MNANVAVLVLIIVVVLLTIRLVQVQASARSAAKEKERLAFKLLCAGEALGETKEALDLERDEHARTRKQNNRLTALVAVQQALLRKAFGIATNCKARSAYWEDQAMTFWTEIKKQQAAEQREENRTLGFAFLETFLSVLIPHKWPVQQT